MVMFVLVAIVLAESVRSWIRLSKTVPQDYRTQDEIEEQTKKELEEAGKTVSALLKRQNGFSVISGFYVVSLMHEIRGFLYITGVCPGMYAVVQCTQHMCLQRFKKGYLLWFSSGEKGLCPQYSDGTVRHGDEFVL